MEIEQLEIIDYLKKTPPLNDIGRDSLIKIGRDLKISYVRRGEHILKAGQTNNTIYLIRTGAVEVYDTDDSLYNHFDEGDWVGYRSAFGTGLVTMTILAIEDCLLYEISNKILTEIAVEFPTIKVFFDSKKRQRLKVAKDVLYDKSANLLYRKSAADLISDKKHILILDQDTPIIQVANKMKDLAITSCLLQKDNNLTGIVSDRTFCTKVVAQDVSNKQPISSVMTTSLITIDEKTKSSDALLLMMKHNIHRLPIVKQDGDILGIITVNDIILAQSFNSIYLINEIQRADSCKTLAKLSSLIPRAFANMVEAGMLSYDIGHAISAIGRAINQRLLYLAEKKYGKSSISYAWIIAGSQARDEQTLHSDQDNMIIIDDGYDELKHQDYFKNISKFVCDGLADCGFVYCPGDVMATNKKWCAPLSVWIGYFHKWINAPQPRALMLSSIFFDLDFIHGDINLLNKLKEKVSQKLQGNSIFLSHMAANALHYQPPLGLFRSFVLEKHGKEDKALDMKKRGITPITDLARVYALSAGALDVINTTDRLKQACKNGKLSKKGKKDLLESYEFIATIRLKHQLKQVQKNNSIDNYVSPTELSSLEKKHLKDAFEIVRTMQSSMANSYQTQRLL
jgi:CBS domain-containing protein